MRWSESVKRAVWPFEVVFIEVSVEQFFELPSVLRLMEVDAFILYTAPQAFYESVVRGPALAVHADPDVVESEQPCEVVGCELAALIGVEDARTATRGQRIVERIDTERGVEGIAHLP